jgi:hypothetical protein
MGNIQYYCGESCINSDSNLKLQEKNIPQKIKLNNYQEISLIKAINTIRILQKEKKDPFSTKNLTKKIKKLDEFIQIKQGKFVDLMTFENLINKEIYNIYTKLSIKEHKYGFKSFKNTSNSNTNFIDSNEENISSINQLNFLFLRKPVILEETGDIYLGYWNLQGEREGYGKLVKNDGILIEGYWEPNGYCKYGRYFFPNGTYYEGNLKNNLPDTYYENTNNFENFNLLNYNKGKLKLFENEIYNGEWEYGKFNGKGLLFISNKSKYEGEFKDSLFSGQGNLLYSDIDEYNYSYKGQFEKSKFEGEGYFKLTNNKNKVEEIEDYNGLWKNGLPNGNGIYNWKSGNRYIGFYLDGKKKGQGKYIFNSGNSYFEGIWSNGKPNGKGFLMLDNNLKVSGVWRQGKIQKIDNLEDIQNNNNQRILDFQIENEIFNNDFFLNINYITPYKENPIKIFFDEKNGKIIQNSKVIKILSKILEKI